MATKLNKEDTKKWNYRIIKRKPEGFAEFDGADYYTIEEVFYDEKGNPSMHTTDLGIGATSLQELKQQVEMVHKALTDEVVEEIVPEEAEDIPSPE